ncbi:MAG: Fis family transcriptional regulator [Candidatus Zixiibacteriota bacterium]|nr:MAG: Fis family transcriptional regulator [candidate division Zixibacteria bacterium]
MEHKPDECHCDMLTAVVDSISDGVLAVDLDRRITFMNRAAERITGFSQQDAFGKHCWEVFHTNVCKDSCPLKRAMNGTASTVNRPVCITNRRGKGVPVSISATLLRDAQGTVIGGVETLRDLDLIRQLHKEHESQYVFEDMISRSKKMRELFEILPAIAESESTVLIEGESGTGKELIARAIHSLSPRKDGPFVALNCGALPDNLLESELFGYVAGAFTDAKKDKKGRFAIAKGGTLLLDEIGDVSQAMQVRLLRVLQEKIYEPLGGTVSVPADVRVIAATNKRLDQLVEANKFRNDLYYRINVMRVQLPSLQDRKEDIPLLVDHFIDRFNRLRQKNVPGFSPPALSLLLNHSFPGNVRELENIIEHASVLCGGGIIRPEHLPEYLHGERPIPAVEIAGTFAEMETLFLVGALKRNNWSRKDTAAEIGINPSTLFRKIKKLGLKLPKDQD